MVPNHGRVVDQTGQGGCCDIDDSRQAGGKGMHNCSGGLDRWSSSSEESLMSDGSEEQLDGHRKPKDESGTTGCTLRQWAERRFHSHALEALMHAHIGLDERRDGTVAGSVWKDVQLVLKRQVNQKDLLAEVRRDFRMRGESLPERIFASSIARLLARVDDLFDRDSKTGVRSREYSATLSSSERKALHACLQIWRKTLRGSMRRFDGPHTSRMATCVEVSAMCRTKQYPALVICVGVEALQRSEDQLCLSVLTDWQVLYICCTTVGQWKRAVADVLPTLPLLNKINITPHCLALHDARMLWSTLPPIAYTRGIEWDGVRSDTQFALGAATMDSRHLCAILANFHARVRIPQPMRPAALLISAAYVLQTSRQTGAIGSLPNHLQHLVENVYRCSSCARLVSASRSKDGRSLSVNFQRAAAHAGFTLESVREEMLVSSLKARSLWLPSFHEPIRRLHSPDTGLTAKVPTWTADGSRVGEHNLGGLEPGQEDFVASAPSLDDRYLTWRFCLPCGAAHLGVSGYGDGKCRCQICTFERETRIGQAHQPWIRYLHPEGKA